MAGREWSARAWTVSAACSRRKYSLFKFLRQAIDVFYLQNKRPFSAQSLILTPTPVNGYKK
jgi:hypothetical protein